MKSYYGSLTSQGVLGSSLKPQDSFNKYMFHVNSFPMLTHEEETSLLVKFCEYGDISAGKAIVNAHLRLVVKIAFEFKRYHTSIMDLIFEGNLGLMKALKNFSIAKKVRFSTYAMLWIKANIQEYLIKSMSIAKIGTTAAQKRIIFGFSKVKKYLGIVEQNQVDDNIGKIAKLLNVQESEVLLVRGAINGTKSANDTVGDDSGSDEVLDFITDNSATIEERAIEVEENEIRRNSISKSLLLLNDRERDIISSRYLSDEKVTLQHLSDKYNVSIERIRQIEANALQKLKKTVKI